MAAFTSIQYYEQPTDAAGKSTSRDAADLAAQRVHLVHQLRVSGAADGGVARLQFQDWVLGTIEKGEGI